MSHADLINKLVDKWLGRRKKARRKPAMTYATMVRRIQRTKPSLRLKRGRATSLSA